MSSLGCLRAVDRAAARKAAPAILAAVAITTAGCTSVSAQNADRGGSQNSLLPTAESAVFVTRVGDEVTISWLSQTGMVYTLISKDRSQPDSKWTPVTGYEKLPGTGRQESITLRVPADDPRVFNITAAPASQAGRPKR